MYVSDNGDAMTLPTPLQTNGGYFLNGTTSQSGELFETEESYSIERAVAPNLIRVTHAGGTYLYAENGDVYADGSGGASVPSVGHCHPEVMEAIVRQLHKVAYVNTLMFKVNVVDEITEVLAKTGGFGKVWVCSSGSEAMEASMKLGRQYFYEQDQPQKVNFIARHSSYHGTTLGALSMSGHKARREKFLPLLYPNVHRVSDCYAYRQQGPAESDASFVSKKAAELEALILHLGAETVIGFVCEPIVGATLGCVPFVPGYLAAMKAVCHRHGLLFILDEVMCGMGRSGKTMHAWQLEHSDEPGRDCRPDIQTIGKGLAGGHEPMGAVLIGKRVAAVLHERSQAFAHGQTYQSSPVACAAALAVQQIIRREGLLENCERQGKYLSELLHRHLDDHPHVGDIRGRGLFRGIEFVRDKETKEPFDFHLGVAKRVSDMALLKKLSVYPGVGTADGVRGDHIILSPALNCDAAFIELIVGRIVEAITEVFKQPLSGTRKIITT